MKLVKQYNSTYISVDISPVWAIPVRPNWYPHLGNIITYNFVIHDWHWISVICDFRIKIYKLLLISKVEKKIFAKSKKVTIFSIRLRFFRHKQLLVVPMSGLFYTISYALSQYKKRLEGFKLLSGVLWKTKNSLKWKSEHKWSLSDFITLVWIIGSMPKLVWYSNTIWAFLWCFKKESKMNFK